MNHPDGRVRPGCIVRGPTLPEPIEVLATVAFGESLKVIGRGRSTGLTHDAVLTPAQLAQLEVSADREPFDGEARLFRLGIEAQRLGLAYAYDPFFSLSIARVDPLPHQLEAVSPHSAYSGWFGCASFRGPSSFGGDGRGEAPVAVAWNNW